jgi:hypothetical protein
MFEKMKSKVELKYEKSVFAEAVLGSVRQTKKTRIEALNK